MIRIAKTRPESAKKGWRRFVAFAAPAVLVLVGAAGVAAAGGDGGAKSPGGTDPADPATAPTGPIEAENGRIPVAGDDGTIAGFVDAEAYADPEGLPPADLGSGDRAVFAAEVTDESGQLVGYYVQLLGFVDLATARDDAAVDALFAEYDALQDRPRPTGYQAWLDEGSLDPSAG